MDLFGKNREQYDNEYAKAIKDTEKAKADNAYNYYYNKALYDANKDYFTNLGVEDPSKSYWNESGQRVNALMDSENQYGKYINDLKKERADAWERNKYNKFGDGILPSLLGLNAFNQYVDSVNDLGKGLQNVGANTLRGANIEDPFSEWNKRDHLSDLGATIEAGASLVPFVGGGVGAATKGASLASNAGNTLGKSILKGAGVGAAYGGVGNLASYLQQNGDKSNVGGAIASGALGAGIGGLMGGSLSGVGYGAGKLWNKYSQPAPSKSTGIIPYSGGVNTSSTAYQDAINALREYGLDPNDVSGTLKSAHRTAARATHPDKVGSDTAFKTIQDAYNTLSGKGGSTATAAAPVVTSAPNLSFTQKLKNFGYNIPNMGRDLAKTRAGNKVSKLLKTRTGKIGAGIGGGLLLSQLIRNNNNSGGQ